MTKKNQKRQEKLFTDIKALLEQSRKVVTNSVNTMMVLTYFHIGRLIIENEQEGKRRADYAKEIIKTLSSKLTEEYGRGFSERNLRSFRQFYLIYKESEIWQSLIAKFEESDILAHISKNPFRLSWTHYLILLRIKDEDERKFYEIEVINERWSVRELERQVNSALYERLALNRDKNKVKELSKKGQIISGPGDMLKEPYVLEFLGLKEESSYTENDLETAIINKIEQFILELGKGFLFSGRQVRFSFDDEHFFVDLVFYNRLLRCFVLIDLKIGRLRHQDIGQMQMYVNYYDRKIRTDEENPTIGIILCKDKRKNIVEFTLPKNNKQIFASEYQLYLPSKEELIKQLEEFNSK